MVRAAVGESVLTVLEGMVCCPLEGAPDIMRVRHKAGEWPLTSYKGDYMRLGTYFVLVYNPDEKFYFSLHTMSTQRCNAEENEEYMANTLNTMEFQEFMEGMNYMSECALFWEKSTMQCRFHLLNKFIIFHCQNEKLAPYADKILKQRHSLMSALHLHDISFLICLAEHCCYYLTAHIQALQALIKKSNAENERMSWLSLRKV